MDISKGIGMTHFLKKGFTLIELLVVISIIAILVAMGAVSYSDAQKKARDATRIGNMKDIEKAMEQNYSPAGVYAIIENASSPGQCVAFTGLNPFPTDPKASWTAYSCAQNATITSYCACAFMEGASGGNSNSAADDTCSGIGGGTTYYCVKNKQ